MNPLRAVAVKNKWIVKGDGEGWVKIKPSGETRQFRTKWRAELAIEVFEKGGEVTYYWKETKEHAERRQREIWRREKKWGEAVERAYEEIKALEPRGGFTCEEIKEYGEKRKFATFYEGREWKSIVTITEDNKYYPPILHGTDEQKWQGKYNICGKVHVDLGCCGYKIKLPEKWPMDFIKFIKNKRKGTTNSHPTPPIRPMAWRVWTGTKTGASDGLGWPSAFAFIPSSF